MILDDLLDRLSTLVGRQWATVADQPKGRQSPVPTASQTGPADRWHRAETQPSWRGHPDEKEETLSTTTTTEITTVLHDPPTPVRAKLAAAWTSFMFFYIYVDYLHLYKPGAIDDILDGVVFEFDISQAFVVISLLLVGIPSMMIVLSATLHAGANRMLNLVVASLYIPVSAFNVVGESWTYFYGLGAVLEVILLVYILRAAWTWPRTAP
jgi:Family of unknown function (DUF6326)